MSIKELKQQIITAIDKIETLELGNLYSTGSAVVKWNEMEQVEVQEFVFGVNSVLKKLRKNIDLLNTVSHNNVLGLKNHLEAFVSSLEGVNVPQDQINTHHHNPLNQLQGANNILGSTGLYSQLELIPNLDKKKKEIQKASLLAQEIINKKSDLENATKTLQTYLDKKEEVRDKAIKEYTVTFKQRSLEHKIKRKEKFFSWRFSGNWWWLLAMFLFGLVVGYITYLFILEAGDNNVTLGQSLLRISSLLIPGYFTVFCAQQFLYHKKMYETYSFKEVAVNTMNKLRETVGDEKVQEKILDRGLDVIFSEPSASTDKGAYDKQLVGELLSMLQKQINNG